MRAFVLLTLTSLSLVGCSPGPTRPTTSAVTTSPNTAPLPHTDSTWSATSTVVAVSPTLNNCPVDHSVGQIRTAVWSIEERSSSPSILIFTGDDYMADPTAPLYYGSRTDNQFATVAEQDGQSGCFVSHGDLTGSFSVDSRTFDAVENVRYVHFGEDDMVVQRHWTGTQR
jgi:hypothetical protein